MNNNNQNNRKNNNQNNSKNIKQYSDQLLNSVKNFVATSKGQQVIQDKNKLSELFGSIIKNENKPDFNSLDYGQFDSAVNQISTELGQKPSCETGMGDQTDIQNLALSVAQNVNNWKNAKELEDYLGVKIKNDVPKNIGNSVAANELLEKAKNSKSKNAPLFKGQKVTHDDATEPLTFASACLFWANGDINKAYKLADKTDFAYTRDEKTKHGKFKYLKPFFHKAYDFWLDNGQKGYNPATSKANKSYNSVSIGNSGGFVAQKKAQIISEAETVITKIKKHKINELDKTNWSQESIDDAKIHVEKELSKYNPPKSNQDIIYCLMLKKPLWHINKFIEGDYQAKFKPANIIDIILDTVHVAILYSTNTQKEIDAAGLQYYDLDRNIYVDSESMFQKFILAVDRDFTSRRSQKDLIAAMRHLPDRRIIYHQYTIALTNRFLCVKNGILNLKPNKFGGHDLYKFDDTTPTKWFFNTRLETSYNPDATIEPIFLGWDSVKNAPIYTTNHTPENEKKGFMWSSNMKQIASVMSSKTNKQVIDKAKLKLLWETTKAGVIGAGWLRQGVILIDNGTGKTGKSTFEDAIMNVVGQMNTAQLLLAEMQKETNVADLASASLVIGDDNDVYTPITHYENLNRVLSGELMTSRRLYHNRKLMQAHCFVIQSANGIPNFQNATKAFLNRLVFIKFNKQHNNAKKADWNVKNRYIKTDEFKEWLLWFVVNKVELGISLKETHEDKEIRQDTFTEADSIESFIKDGLPNIESNVIPSGWLYSYYGFICTKNGIKDQLSKKRFTREIRQRPEFTKLFTFKANGRVKPYDEFSYQDADMLVSNNGAHKWGHYVDNFFKTNRLMEQSVINGSEIASDHITDETFTKKLKHYHGSVFIRRTFNTLPTKAKQLGVLAISFTAKRTPNPFEN